MRSGVELPQVHTTTVNHAQRGVKVSDAGVNSPRAMRKNPIVGQRPAIVGLFGVTQCAASLRDRLSIAQGYLHFPQLGKDLCDSMTKGI